MKRLILISFAFLFMLSAYALSLDSCYAKAKRNYPLIAKYQLTERLKDYSFYNATSAWLPQLSLSGQITYQSDVTSFPDEMTRLYEQIGLDIKGLNRDQYKLMLSLNQTIWDGGVSVAQKKIAQADAEVANLQVEKELDALKSRINQIYFGILVMEENLKTNLYMDTLLQNNLSQMQSALDNGVVMQSDFDQIKVELLSLKQQRSQIESTINAYRQVLSLFIGEAISDSEALERPQIPTINNDVNNRAELRLFDAQIAKNDAQRRQINSTIMPRFDLFAQGWYGRPGLDLFDDMINNKFSFNALAGVRLNWNISGFYTRKSNINKLKVANEAIEVQRGTFLWNLDMQQMQLKNEIEKMANLQADDDEIVELRQSIRRASESKYHNGTITMSELLRDILNENNAIQTRTIHQLDMLRNIYELKTSLNQ